MAVSALLERRRHHRLFLYPPARTNGKNSALDTRYLLASNAGTSTCTVSAKPVTRAVPPSSGNCEQDAQSKSVDIGDTTDACDHRKRPHTCGGGRQQPHLLPPVLVVPAERWEVHRLSEHRLCWRDCDQRVSRRRRRLRRTRGRICPAGGKAHGVDGQLQRRRKHAATEVVLMMQRAAQRAGHTGVRNACRHALLWLPRVPPARLEQTCRMSTDDVSRWIRSWSKPIGS